MKEFAQSHHDILLVQAPKTSQEENLALLLFSSSFYICSPSPHTTHSGQGFAQFCKEQQT